MMLARLALLCAGLGLAAAQWGDYGWAAGFACPNEPEMPRSGRDTCKWKPVKHPLNGCIFRWRCHEVDPAPRPCPEAPAKPTTGKNCNWVTMRDDRGCIVDYECEPVTQPPCPRRPQRPDNTERCYYRAIKNNNGCVVDYECEPLGPRAIPVFQPRPMPILRRRPVFRPQVAAPLPTFGAGWGNIGAGWGNLGTANLAANSFNQANLQATLARAQSQANFANSAALSAFAPRLPILKDQGFETAGSDFGARKDLCFNANTELVEVENTVTKVFEERPACAYWAEAGECVTNPEYMLELCRASCDQSCRQ